VALLGWSRGVSVAPDWSRALSALLSAFVAAGGGDAAISVAAWAIEPPSANSAAEMTKLSVCLLMACSR
jgi:hypothetical protein